MKTIIKSGLKATLPILSLVLIAACQPSTSDEKKPAPEQAKLAQTKKDTPSKDHLRDNEELMYGFVTEKGKVLTIAKDKEDKYIIYRYGPPGKVEFEFPPEGKDSYELMTYSSYMSPGNADLNYLRFNNGDFMYVVYDKYIAEQGKHFFGIKLIDKKNKKEFDIKGDEGTRKGSLIDLRFMDTVNSDMFTL